MTTEPTVVDRGSPLWRVTWRVLYALIRVLDPLIRSYLALGGLGLERIVDVRVAGRRTGRERAFLVTLLPLDGRAYIGHPNGHASWVTNSRGGRGRDPHRHRRAAGGRPGDPPGAGRRTRCGHPEHGVAAAVPRQPRLSRVARPHPARRCVLPARGAGHGAGRPLIAGPPCASGLQRSGGRPTIGALRGPRNRREIAPRAERPRPWGACHAIPANPIRIATGGRRSRWPNGTSRST